MLSVSLLLCGALLALPSSALAFGQDYYASPSGSGTACSQPAPCGIDQVFTTAGANDTVLLAGGTYHPSGSITDSAFVPRWISGGTDHPLIVFSGTDHLSLSASNSWIAGVDITAAGSTAVSLTGGAVAMSGIFRATGVGYQTGTAVVNDGSKLLSDVVIATTDGGAAVYSNTPGVLGIPGAVSQVRNVTALATGSPSSSALYVERAGNTVELDAVNTAVIGQVKADAHGSGTAKLVLTTSMRGGATLNSGGQIVDPSPMFGVPDLVDPALVGGDYHQAHAGDTGTNALTDAGTDATANGLVDLEMSSRQVGTTDIGAYEYVPPPIVTTEAATQVAATSAMLNGTAALRGISGTTTFEYGPTASYGSTTTAGAMFGTAAAPVTEFVESLAPGTTYHYRLRVAGDGGTRYGADRTFTTPAASSGSGSGAGAGAGSGSGSKGPGTSTSTPSAGSGGAGTSTSAGAATGTRAPAPTMAASPALACGTAQIALIDVVPSRGKLVVTGATIARLAGQVVRIQDVKGKVVATATVAADGTFSATAPKQAPSARLVAAVGSLRSAALKVSRRLYLTRTQRAGGNVLIAGRVTGRFTAGTSVVITVRTSCTGTAKAVVAKLGRTGTFTASAPAPTGAAAAYAVYRAQTTVLTGRKPSTTYSLPHPPTA
jgi:hypothetical protein